MRSLIIAAAVTSAAPPLPPPPLGLGDRALAPASASPWAPPTPASSTRDASDPGGSSTSGERDGGRRRRGRGRGRGGGGGGARGRVKKICENLYSGAMNLSLSLSFLFYHPSCVRQLVLSSNMRFVLGYHNSFAKDHFPDLSCSFLSCPACASKVWICYFFKSPFLTCPNFIRILL